MADQQRNLTVIAPPFQITATDHRGVLVVVASVTLSFVVTCLMIRVYLRTRTRDWGRDDTLLALATLCCCCQGAAVFVMIHEGTGIVGVNNANMDRLGTANYSQQFLYLITLFLSKTVVVFLYLRLSVHRQRAIAIYCAFALIVVWLIVSLVILNIWCDPKQYWTQGTKCPQNLAWRWDIVGTIDIATEAILFLIAVSMVVGLQMPTRTKMIIVSVFSVRLPLIATSAARLHFIHQLATSRTPALEIASALVCSQFQLDFAIMTSTICCLGPFLRPFEDDADDAEAHASSTSGDASYARSSKRRRSRGAHAAEALGPECGRLGDADGEWLGCAHHRPRARRRDTTKSSEFDGAEELGDADGDEVRLCGGKGSDIAGDADAVPLTTLRISTTTTTTTTTTTSPRTRGRRHSGWHGHGYGHGHGHGRNASALSVVAARSPPGSGCPSRSLSVASAHRRPHGMGMGLGLTCNERGESSSNTTTNNNGGLELRPDYYQHTTYAGRDEGGAISVSELDGVSLASGDSQRLIIAKTVVTVDVEQGPAVVALRSPVLPLGDFGGGGGGGFLGHAGDLGLEAQRHRRSEGDDERTSWSGSQTAMELGTAL